MIDPDNLNVWFGDRLLGYLWRNALGQIGFQYDSQWLSSDGIAISRQLPLQLPAYEPESIVAHRFFANLLPEGGAREQIVRDLKLTNTDFNLMRAIGGECAGALSILPIEYEPSVSHHYEKLTEEKLTQLVKRRGHGYGNNDSDARPRLSLAGAQHKCAVMIRDEDYLLPVGDAPSTHILKFESHDYRHLPLYETYTTLLAKAVGLPVVDIEWQSIANKHFVRVARYDRLLDKHNVISRVHQEDFCQALGYSHEKKYQHDGGPDFAEVVQMVRDVSDDPARDVQNLLRWQIFNVLAGNSDGHAKNLSLLYQTDGSIRLTPFYDLVCTRAVDRIDTQLAFAVGDQRDPQRIVKDDWQAFASRCDIKAQYLLKLVTDMASRLPDIARQTHKQFDAVYGEQAAVERVDQIVSQQCKRAIAMV